MPKDHQGVAPCRVRNPWYQATAGAEPISLTAARMSVEEYGLKRRFLAEQTAASSDRDTNGVKMKKCGESDIPEDIRDELYKNRSSGKTDFQ